MVCQIARTLYGMKTARKKSESGSSRQQRNKQQRVLAVVNTKDNSMKTYNRLTLAFLLLAIVGCGKDVTTYQANGHKESEGNLRDNKKHGLWTFWHENGEKKVESHFKNGKQIHKR